MTVKYSISALIKIVTTHIPYILTYIYTIITTIMPGNHTYYLVLKLRISLYYGCQSNKINSGGTQNTQMRNYLELIFLNWFY